MASVRNAFLVMVVDDDPGLLRLAEALLQAEGCSVVTAATGREALDAFTRQPAALVLLDVDLPDFPGTEVCRQLRALPAGDRAFVLILSGKRELADRLAGFHAGADDYVTKPLDTDELSLRVRAIRRRLDQPAAESGDGVMGTWRLDGGLRTLTVADTVIPLTPAEYQLVQFLMRHPQTFFSSEQLLREVWQYPPGTGSTDLVRYHVRNLRRKFEPEPEHPKHLVSAPHHGYMLKP